MKKEVIIIGSGGHGAEIDEYIQLNNNIAKSENLKVIGFLDDNPDNYYRYKFSAPLLGSIKEHSVERNYFYVIGIANLQYRKDIVESFLEKNVSFISVIHATAYISPSATLGKGVVIGPMANIGPNVKIGDYSLINARCSLAHDTIVGKFNFISPNVCFSGFTNIGDGNLFGINSATIPNITIGNNNKIAAGMVLHNDVGDGETVFYKYKERIIAKPNFK
ncbi:MAG: acetyltransferase [Ignavibacteria bacterium]|jgi:sugar O-acyltransferase (sialic acid O-acetyltransferase NeuD family)